MAERSTRTAAIAAIVTVLVGLAGIAGWVSGTGLLSQSDEPDAVHTIPDPELINNADELRQELLDDGYSGVSGGSSYTYVYVKFDRPPKGETCPSETCFNVSAVVLQRCDTLTLTLDLMDGFSTEVPYDTASATFTNVTPGEVMTKKLQVRYAGYPDRIVPQYGCSRL